MPLSRARNNAMALFHARNAVLRALRNLRARVWSSRASVVRTTAISREPPLIWKSWRSGFTVRRKEWRGCMDEEGSELARSRQSAFERMCSSIL